MNPKQSAVLLDPASLNKEGVSWLAFGRNREAIECFKQALVTMKASLHANRDPNHPETTTLPPPPCLSHDKYSTVSIPLQEERFYMYARAAEFSSQQGGTVCERDYPLYSALILFNIGLSYHLRSQAQQGAEERALNDAAYFYSMSLQILEAIHPYFRKSTIAPIKLAALNNLAVVNYEQGNARKAFCILRDTYQLLSPTLLRNNNDENTSTEDNSCFDQSDFDGITLNSVMTKWTFTAPCA